MRTVHRSSTTAAAVLAALLIAGCASGRVAHTPVAAPAPAATYDLIVRNGTLYDGSGRAERPELVTMFEGQVPFYRARLLVKPGITGWAQVNFGYASSIEDTMVKLEYDLYYIKHRSLTMDFLILLRTPAMMLGSRGR